MASPATIDVSPPAALGAFVDEAVRSGRFRDASEAVAAGLRGLRSDTADDSAADEGRATMSADRITSRCRAILERALDDAIMAFDRDDRAVEWNAGAVAITGRTEAEMLGGDGAGDAAEPTGTNGQRTLAHAGRRRPTPGQRTGHADPRPRRPLRLTSEDHAGPHRRPPARTRSGRERGEAPSDRRGGARRDPRGRDTTGRVIDANRRMDRPFGPHRPRSGEAADHGGGPCFHPDDRRAATREYPLAAGGQPAAAGGNGGGPAIRLRQPRTMEAVGQRTGGIAHDVNNMLG